LPSHPAAHALHGDPAPPRLDLDWAGARQHIASAENYYVCSAGPDSAPHVVPVLGVWVDDVLVFNTQRSARKYRQLVQNPAVAVAVTGPAYDFTLEGIVKPITEPAALDRVVAAFPVKYTCWHPYIRDGEFHADDSTGARTVFAVQPRDVFGFGKSSGFSGTRWSFDK
jgi:hypothetical protein